MVGRVKLWKSFGILVPFCILTCLTIGDPLREIV